MTAAEHFGHFTRLPRNATPARMAAPHAQVTRTLSLFGAQGVPRSSVPVAVSDSSFADGAADGGAMTEAAAAATGIAGARESPLFVAPEAGRLRA